MQGADQHIRSSLGLSLLPKDTSTCRPGESNQLPSNKMMPALPLSQDLLQKLMGSILFFVKPPSIQGADKPTNKWAWVMKPTTDSSIHYIATAILFNYNNCNIYLCLDNSTLWNSMLTATVLLHPVPKGSVYIICDARPYP